MSSRVEGKSQRHSKFKQMYVTTPHDS